MVLVDNVVGPGDLCVAHHVEIIARLSARQTGQTAAVVAAS